MGYLAGLLLIPLLLFGFRRGLFAVVALSVLPYPAEANLWDDLWQRADQPGFNYWVDQDSVRGWIIRWKEYTHRGTVRGYGQICERPYAWLED